MNRIVFLPSQEALRKLQIVSGVLRDYILESWLGGNFALNHTIRISPSEKNLFVVLKTEPVMLGSILPRGKD